MAAAGLVVHNGIRDRDCGSRLVNTSFPNSPFPIVACRWGNGRSPPAHQTLIRQVVRFDTMANGLAGEVAGLARWPLLLGKRQFSAKIRRRAMKYRLFFNWYELCVRRRQAGIP